MVVLVFFSVERNTNDAICILDFAIKCICLLFIDLYKNKKFVRKVKKKGIPSRNAFHYFIIMFYREELIACAMDLNSSSDNFSFGFENNISDSF